MKVREEGQVGLGWHMGSPGAPTILYKRRCLALEVYDFGLKFLLNTSLLGHYVLIFFTIGKSHSFGRA
jgi:hypothetical protein